MQLKCQFFYALNKVINHIYESFFSQLEDGRNWHQLRPENTIKVQQENSCQIHTIKTKILMVKVDEL